MPELPEVQTTLNKVKSWIVKRQIKSFSASWPRQIKPSIPQVKKAVVGHTVISLSRRGKYLILELNNKSYLIIHLGMSGRLEWSANCYQPPAHVRARMVFSKKDELLFCDARKFGKIIHTSDLAKTLGHLGLEPLDKSFTPTALAQAIAATSRPLKTVLLNQSVVAGLGNIYADETLFRSRLHPLRSANSLCKAEIYRLQRAIVYILSKAIKLCGTSFDWVYPGGKMQSRLKVYRRGALPCMRCGKVIQVIKLGGRSTHFCKFCQPKKTISHKRMP